MPAAAFAQRAEELPPHRLDTPVEMRVPGRIFLQLTPDAVRSGEGEEFISTMTRMFDGRVLRRYNRLLPGMVLLQVRTGDERVVADIARMSHEVQSIAWDTWGGTNATPNDPRAVNGDMDFWRQRVCIDAVWDVGITSSANIITAIIDTGVNYMHPDLVGNMWVNSPEVVGLAGIDDDGNGVIDDIHGAAFIWPDAALPPPCAFDLYPLGCSTGVLCPDSVCEYATNTAQLLASGISNDPFDRDAASNNLTSEGTCPCPDKQPLWTGHGTLTAAMVGATGDNELFASGAAWSARIMAVRVFDTPWRMGFVSDFIAALEYIVSNPEVRVAAITLTYEYSSALEEAVAQVTALGVTLVCAAGNANQLVPATLPSGRFYPAAFHHIPGVISVGASDCNDARYVFSGASSIGSNWGPETVDVFAPGINGGLPVLDTGYGFTSGASALAAGIIGIYIAENPTATPAQVEATVVNTARATPALLGTCRSNGVIDARALLGVQKSCPPITPCSN